jgi:ankyrin repeat protein
MEDKLDIIAKQLVENKYCDNKILLESLSNFQKFCLNKVYNMNFEKVYGYTDEYVWFESCGFGYIKVIQYFIDNGVDVNMQEHDKSSEEHDKSSALITAAWNTNFDLVKFLLQQPYIDVNIQDCTGNTALIFACWFDDISIVYLLLQHQDIDINIKNVNGKTALDKAVNFEIKQLLENHGR